MNLHVRKLLIAVAIFNVSFVLRAQPILPHDRPSGRALEVPELQNVVPPKLILPKPKLPQDTLLSNQANVFVKGYEFSGNTVVGTDELEHISEPYSRRLVSNNELHNLRLAITQYYINKGYINSGAVLPDQDVLNGIIRIQIIEGMLNEIHVYDTQRLTNNYISRQINYDRNSVLNIKELQNNLLLLQRDPRIAQINAQLLPGERLGESLLDLHVREAGTRSLSVDINNHGPPSVGEMQGVISFQDSTLFGQGDTLTLDYGLTEGLDFGNISYDLPVLTDSSLGFRYSRNDSTVVEEPFDAIDIKNQSDTLELHYRQIFYRTLNEEYTLTVTLEKRRSETRILDVLTPLEGPNPQHITPFRLIWEWISHSTKEILALRSVFSKGLNRFGANYTDIQEPNADFAAWLGQAQWLSNIEKMKLQIRANLQLAGSTLPPMERFAIGGVNSVRGYRENQLVGDEGIQISTELRIPFAMWNWRQQTADVVPFLDYGRTTKKATNSERKKSLYSAGMGMHWRFAQNWYFKGYWAHAFVDIDNPQYSLQEDGIHLQLKYKKVF